MTTLASRFMKLDHARAGILLICLVSFIWALMEIVTSYAALRYSLYQVVWVRYAVHLLFMLLVFVPARGPRWIATRRPAMQFGRALMMLVMPVSFILAAEHMNVGNILAVFWLAPLMVTGLAALMLKERPAWHTWALNLAGLVCVLVLVRPNGAFTLLGTLLALTMGLSFSLYIVLTNFLHAESTLTNLFYTALGVLIPLSLGLPIFWQPLDLTGALLMGLVGLLGFALLWLLDKALEMTSTALVAPFLYSQMFWMIVLRLLTRVL